MYTRRNRCLPTFHSTSTISRPSERATRSAAPRIFSKSTQRLPDHSRSAVHSNRRQQKSGLAPTHSATRFRAKTEYIPAARQKQDTGGCQNPLSEGYRHLSEPPASRGYLRSAGTRMASFISVFAFLQESRSP